MESFSTVVVENLSGCARTDYRSNHALLERAKFRRKLLNYKRGRKKKVIKFFIRKIIINLLRTFTS